MAAAPAARIPPSGCPPCCPHAATSPSHPLRLYNVPWAINRMVTYMDKRYNRPDIWVLENGAQRLGAARGAQTLLRASES